MARNHFLPLILIILLITGPVAAENGTIHMVSWHSPGGEDGESRDPVISGDGRYVAYTSFSSNLVNDDFNMLSDVFVYDTILNTTERISIANNGSEANGDSFNPSISSDGRFVSFSSIASNLVDNDANGFADIFVRDRWLNTTEIISISFDNQGANSYSSESSISGDGRFVAFSSWADNLVESDINGWGDVFVRDRLLNITHMVTLNNNGDQQLTWYNLLNDEYEPCISADGRFVAFSSYSETLVDNDNNSQRDVFVRDLNLNTTYLVSVPNEFRVYDSYNPSISGNGSFIAFLSDINQEGLYSPINVFVWDRRSGITYKISNFSEVSGLKYNNPSISTNGRYIAFSADFDDDVCSAVSMGEGSSEIVSSNPLSPMFSNILVYDQVLNVTTSILQGVDGEEPNSRSGNPSISGDGTRIVFESLASNLVRDDNNYVKDVFLYSFPSSFQIEAWLKPFLGKSGTSMKIEAYSSDNIVNMTASILGNEYPLVKWNNSKWFLNFTVPPISDGNYPVIIEGMDINGTKSAVNLNFTVDNTPPSMIASINSYFVKSGDKFQLSAFCDDDTHEVSAQILQDSHSFTHLIKTSNLVQDTSGEWDSNFIFPKVSDGNYYVKFTAKDRVGNINIVNLNFIVDNTPPSVKPTVSPNKIKYHGTDAQRKLTISAAVSPDTQQLFAVYNNKRINLTNVTGKWSCIYLLPYSTSSGKKYIDFAAVDYVGNWGYATTYFNVLSKSGNLVTSTSKHSNVLQSATVKNKLNIIKPEADLDAFSVSIVLTGNISLLKSEWNPTIDLNKGSDDAMVKYYFEEFFIKTNITSDPLKAYNFLFRSLTTPGGGIGDLIAQYTTMKFSEAIKKAWETGNFWDFWDYTFIHFYGYSNLDHSWGGENIKILLELAFGIDENGNVSIGNLLLNLFAIIPIGRLASLLPKILPKLTRVTRISSLLNENILLNSLKKFFGKVATKFNLNNPKTWENIYSTLSNFSLPNPLSLIMMPMDALARLTGKQRLIKIITEINAFESKRGISEFISLLSSPDPVGKIKESYGKLGEFLTRNGEYIVDNVKNMVNYPLNTLNKIIPEAVHKTTETGKNITQNIVDTTKNIVKTAYSTIKTVKNTIVNTTTNLVKKTAGTVNKIASNVKTVVNKTVAAIKNTVSKSKSILKKGVKTGKSILKKVTRGSRRG